MSVQFSRISTTTLSASFFPSSTTTELLPLLPNKDHTCVVEIVAIIEGAFVHGEDIIVGVEETGW